MKIIEVQVLPAQIITIPILGGTIVFNNIPPGRYAVRELKGKGKKISGGILKAAFEEKI